VRRPQTIGWPASAPSYLPPNTHTRQSHPDFFLRRTPHHLAETVLHCCQPPQRALLYQLRVFRVLVCAAPRAGGGTVCLSANASPADLRMLHEFLSRPHHLSE